MSVIKKLALTALIPLAVAASANVSAHGVNLERVEYWLKKRGVIKADASENEIQRILAEYQSRVGGYTEPKFIKGLVKKAQQNKNVRLAEQLKTNKAQSSAAPKTVKVLAVLIDFPDLLHSSHGLTANDTNMYYPSYPVSHYQDLMFSTSTYTGPNGERLKTAYTYYQEESGGEFFFEGNVYGWVTADNNAATYGGNDPENDRDINVPELIKEAVDKAVAANSINLDDYDLEDPYDFDGDGNLDEADGIIDHVMVFHSSMGEDSGGGRLGDDAIWSHRFFVNQTGNPSTMGHTVNGTNKRLFGYTIQPIDAAIGVVVHEFGHDLGLPDEYDVNTNRGAGKGSPVGHWSVMSHGSWAGSIPGTQPTGFSAYARSYLQERHGTNWVNEVTVDLANLTNSQDINLVEAVEHSANTVNQVRIDVPAPLIDFKSPFAGNYQYHSGEGHNLNNSMSFQIDVPNSDNASLTMKAHWDIEEDWDFARILFNDTGIPGNHTRATNPYTGQYAMYDGVTHYITDKSQNIAGAQGPDYWVDLTYDISQFKGQTITVKFEYRTDTNTGGYGIAVDQIKVLDGTSETYADGAESTGVANFAGYSRITNQRDGLPQNYWVQLRSHNGADSGLAAEGYDRGVVIWFGDSKHADNNSSDHPGEGFVGVVDADQVMIGTADSGVQVRDAAFSMYSQMPYSGDTHLTAKSLFSDADDYSAPTQPESGIKLPVHGLSIDIVNQATDSSTATIRISKQVVINAAFSFNYSGTDVTFANSSTSSGNVSYEWNFGDGSAVSNEANPTHTYAAQGEYTVTLTVTDNDTSDTDTVSQSVRVGALPNANFTSSTSDKTVTFSNHTSGGIGGLTYSWNFGDGNTSTEEAPSHTYSADGSYTVQLTVTDATGAADTYSRQVTIRTVVQPPAGGDSGGGGSVFWALLLLPLVQLRKRT